MSIATIMFLPFLFVWNISWLVICVSIVKWTSGRQHVVGCCFIIQSVIICLLTRVLSPLIFKVIFYKYAFIAILNIFSSCFCISSLFLSFHFCFSFCGLMVFLYSSFLRIYYAWVIFFFGFCVSIMFLICCCSVAQLCLTLCDPMDARLPCPSPSAAACSNFMSIQSVMPSNHLILCHPLLLLPSIFPSIRVFCNESALHIRWPRC